MSQLELIQQLVPSFPRTLPALALAHLRFIHSQCCLPRWQKSIPKQTNSERVIFCHVSELICLRLNLMRTMLRMGQRCGKTRLHGQAWTLQQPLCKDTLLQSVFELQMDPVFQLWMDPEFRIQVELVFQIQNQLHGIKLRLGFDLSSFTSAEEHLIRGRLLTHVNG